MRRYHLTSRNDYARYNMLVGKITKICHLLTTLPPKDPFRIKLTSHLTTKLYQLGLVNQQNNLEACSKITVSAFCRRRLPVVLTVDKWVENIREATQFIQQGHFQIGNQVVKDPNLIVGRTETDQIGWADNSAVFRKIQKFKNQVDDFDLYG